jgi:hypothetical protein
MKYTIIIILGLALAGAVACKGPAKSGGTAAVAAKDAPALSAGQARVEAVLRSAGKPYEPRNDLKLAVLPAGCSWHGVYVTQDPEVILETFVFPKAADAEAYCSARTKDRGAAPERQMRLAGMNKGLLLIACYDEAKDADGKFAAAAPFANAFSAAR